MYNYKIQYYLVTFCFYGNHIIIVVKLLSEEFSI